MSLNKNVTNNVCNLFYQGVAYIIQNKAARTDTNNKYWQGLDDSHATGVATEMVRMFRSEARSLCLQLVSWIPVGTPFTPDPTVHQQALDDIIGERNVEKNCLFT